MKINIYHHVCLFASEINLVSGYAAEEIASFILSTLYHLERRGKVIERILGIQAQNMEPTKNKLENLIYIIVY